MIKPVPWNWKALVLRIETSHLCLSLGLPGGMARSTHSSSSSDIKREDKEDDENSLADKSEEEKKDSKATRNRR